MDVLPRDVLADVLALLQPRTLALSRCVCREWRDIVDADARCQLRTDLLPLSVAGIFMMTEQCDRTPEFFVRPSMAHKIAADLQSYLKMDKEDTYSWMSPVILDCCNGLILLDDHVVNPATRQWTRLPSYPTLPEKGGENSSRYYQPFLVFDPTLSPHFEICSMKDPLDFKGMSSSSEGSEWPPLVYMLRVYSSITGRWEERPFVLEEEPTRTATAMARSNFGYVVSHAVYSHGALYVFSGLAFITRITMSNSKYRVINLPPDVSLTKCYQFRLGKSVNGVHFAVLDEQRLQVWFLDESGGRTEWVLKNVTDYPSIDHQTDRPWILQDGNSYDDDQEENNKEPAAGLNNSDDWDSDDDNAVGSDLGWAEKYPDMIPYIEVLGFHPFKEIVFLAWSYTAVAAYYFNSSKFQDLGVLSIRYQYQCITQAFIYTPSWIGELPGANYLCKNLSNIDEDDLYNREYYY